MTQKSSKNQKSFRNYEQLDSPLSMLLDYIEIDNGFRHVAMQQKNFSFLECWHFEIFHSEIRFKIFNRHLFISRYAFEGRKRREIENLLKKNMRIKTTPTKSRKRTPVKSINFGGGMGNTSVVSGSAYSNKPSTTNIFATTNNAPTNETNAFGINLEPIGRTADVDVPPPTFTPTKQVATTSKLTQFYDEILTIEQLLDLADLNPPSNLVSRLVTPRPASGFTSLKHTPTKGVYTKSQSYFNDFDSYLSKRNPERVDFNDVEEGLRKKLISWDQIEFKPDVLKELVKQYPKF